jgi:hypothetical protein
MPNKRVFSPAHKCSKTMLSKPIPYVKSSNKDIRNTVSLEIVYDVITTKDQKNRNSNSVNNLNYNHNTTPAADPPIAERS